MFDCFCFLMRWLHQGSDCQMKKLLVLPCFPDLDQRFAGNFKEVCQMEPDMNRFCHPFSKEKFIKIVYLVQSVFPQVPSKLLGREAIQNQQLLSGSVWHNSVWLFEPCLASPSVLIIWIKVLKRRRFRMFLKMSWRGALGGYCSIRQLIGLEPLASSHTFEILNSGFKIRYFEKKTGKKLKT